LKNDFVIFLIFF